MVGAVKEPAFTPAPMLAQHFAVVGGKDNERLIIFAGRFQMSDDLADLCIHFGNQPEIDRAHLLAIAFRQSVNIERRIEIAGARHFLQPDIEIGMAGGLLLAAGHAHGLGRHRHINQAVIGCWRNQWRMRPQKHRMDQPVFLATQPQIIDHLVRDIGRVAVLGLVFSRPTPEAF